MSLGEEVTKYVQRKFGECERGQIVLEHGDLRYILTQFTTEWINVHEAADIQKQTLVRVADEIQKILDDKIAWIVLDDKIAWIDGQVVGNVRAYIGQLRKESGK